MTQLTDKHWAVEVLDKIDNPNFYRVNNESIMFKWDDVGRPLNPHDVVRIDKYTGDLKDYKWPVFLFTTATATEEDARKVVESEELFINGNSQGIYYCDYLIPHDVCEWYKHARLSLHSLLRSKGLDENKNYAIIEKL